MAKADPLALFETPDELGLFTEQPKPRSYAARVVGEAAPAIGNLAIDVVQAVPAGIMAAGDFAGALVRGRESPGAQGAETFTRAMESMRERSPRFRGQGIGEMDTLVGEGLEAVREGAGEVAHQFVGDVARAGLGEDFGTAVQEEVEPITRTAGEVGADVAPLGPTARLRGRPVGRASDAAAYELYKTQQAASKNPFVQLEFPEEVIRGRQTEAAQADAAAALQQDRVAAQGEVEGVAEQQAILNRELGQPDLFDSPITRTQEFESSEAAPSLRSKERGPDITELPTEQVPGRAAPLLTEQELYGPVQKDQSPIRTLDAGVRDESTTFEAAAKAEEDAFIARQNAMNERQLAKQQVIEQMRKEAEADAVQPSLANSLYKVRLGIDEGLSKFVDSNDYRGGLEYIRDSHSDKYLSALADQLLKDPNLKPKVMAVESAKMPEGRTLSEGNIVGGLYSTGTDSIQLSKIGGHNKSAVTFLHEGMHSNLSRLLFAWEKGHRVPRRAAEGFETIQGLYDATKSALGPEGLAAFGETGLHNVHEFITHGTTDMGFQAALKDLRYRPKPGQGFLKNVMSTWDAFVESISRILGLDRFKITHLSALLNEVAKVQRELRVNPEAAKMNYGKEAMVQSQLVEDWTSINKAEPTNKAAPSSPEPKADYLEKLKATHDAEIVKRFGDFMYRDYKEKWDAENGPPTPHVGYDNREHADYKKDLFNPAGGLRVGDINHSFGPGYTESKRHPVIRRVYDQVSQAENAINNVYDDLYRGQTVETGKGISALRHGKLKESKDSIGYVASRLPSKAVKEVMDLFAKYGRSDPAKLLDPTFMEKIAGPEAAKFFKSLKELNESALKKLNESRKAAGLEPIAARPDWVTTFSRPGRFHVFTIDPKTGRSEWRAGFDNKTDANKVAAAMRAKGHTDIRVAGAENDPRRFTLPPEAFHEAMKSAEDPAHRKLIQEAMEQSIQRTGTRKYSLPRDSKAGGTPGDIEITEALGHKKSFEHLMYGIKSYVNSVANYTGGLEYAKRVNETLYDNDIRNNYPNAVNASKAMWDSFRGVDRPSGKIAALVQKANMAFTAANVTMLNTPFYLANAMQFGFVPPRLIETNATTLGGKGNVNASMLKALSRMYVNFDGEARAIIREAVDNGSLEARFAEALEWKMAESSWENASRTITLQKAAAMSDSFARGTAYMMFYDLAKSAGKTGKEAHSFAARESQGIMVQYSRWARMPFFNQIGPLGDLASPVTQFITNLSFNLGQYMKLATVGDKKAGLLIGPLLAYLTAQTALSGVRGLPGYEDLDAAVGLLNQAYVEKFGGEWFGTPSEWLHEQGLSDYVVYGTPSAASQVHMTGTLGAGHLLPGFLTQSGDAAKMFPGVDYGLKLVESVMGTSLQAAGLTDLSDATRERLISQVAPGAIKEWVKEGFSGMPVMEGRMVGGNKEAQYLRNPEENVKSLITGKPSLREFEAKEFSYLYKTKEASVGKAKTEAINQLVDSITSGRDMTGYTERVINNYPELIDGMMDKAMTELKSRNVPFYERTLMEVVKGSDLSTARKVQTLEALFGNK